jgi:hypothetical protein
MGFSVVKEIIQEEESRKKEGSVITLLSGKCGWRPKVRLTGPQLDK